MGKCNTQEGFYPPEKVFIEPRAVGVWPELDSSPAQHCHPHLCRVLEDSDSPVHSLDNLMVSLALKISYASKTEGFIAGCAASRSLGQG